MNRFFVKAVWQEHHGEDLDKVHIALLPRNASPWQRRLVGLPLRESVGRDVCLEHSSYFRWIALALRSLLWAASHSIQLFHDGDRQHHGR